MKSRLPFAARLSRDDEAFEQLERRYPVTRVIASEGKSKTIWHRYNLIPNEGSGEDDSTAKTYREMMLVFAIAKGRTDEFERLYSEVEAVQVYELSLLQRAYEY